MLVEANRLGEERSTVVDQSVNSRELLSGLDEAGKEETLAGLDSVRGKECVPASVGSGALVLKCLLDTSEGLLHLRRVDRGVVETLENSDGLSLATLGCEPTGSLGDDEGADHENSNENALESDGDSPDLAASETRETKSVVNPVRDHDSDVEHSEIEGNELTTRDGRRSFGLENWYCRVDCSHSETRNDAAENHDADGRAGGLDDSTCDHEEGADEDGASSAKEVTNDEGSKGADEAADFVERNNVADGVGVGIVEGLLEFSQADDASHNSIVC